MKKVIAKRLRSKLIMDVIIRDMERIDSYPESSDKNKGISPWFKAGLMGTYHKGIQVGLNWGVIENRCQVRKVPVCKSKH